MLKELFGKTQNEKKKNIIRIIYLTVAVILMVSVALAIALAVGSKKDDTLVPGGDDITDTATQKVLKYNFSDTKKGTLIVVNKENSFNFDVNAKSLVSMSTSQFYSLKGADMKANKEALSALNSLLKKFYESAEDKDAAKKLTIWSAYRSFEEQKGSLPAGNSDFHTGMLFELTLNGTSDPIKKDAVFSWIFDHAYEYGFVQRYPSGKSSETGISDFSNAFRYVGIPHAKYMKEHNLCLEEYVSLIKNATEPIISDGYKISYVKANADGQTEITVTSTNYIVSGDNMGGFIVASK